MRLLPKSDELGWAPYVWLIYLAFFLGFPFLNAHPSEAEVAVTLLGVAVFLGLYFRGYWLDGYDQLVSVVGITGIGAIYYPFNPGAGCMFIYAGAFAGWLPKTRDAVIAMGIVDAICAIESWLAGIPIWNSIWPLIFTFLIGALNIHTRQRKEANARLRMAHDEIEHLAKVAERERIARDLHDLLGHTLSLIVLKSELAAKLADRDVERARDEIRDVERISRDALAQVRSAVRGYRSGGVQAELDAARRALVPAGITIIDDVEPLQVPPTHEAVLALALREGITNVVRHADAKQVRISLHRDREACVLQVIDDGRGGNAPFGTGLAGMRERVASLGGTLTRDGRHGTTLTITLPLPPAGPAATLGERSA